MVSNVIYVIVPVFLAIGILRKFREYQWGHCKTKSSLEGRIYLITGGNSGIGKETARELVRRKAMVIMACRNMVKAKEAIEDIRSTISTGELIPMELDLASTESIRVFAKNVLRDFPKIHVVIENAGLAVPVEEKRKTDDGFEINFGVNHLGHFLLTNLLLPRLKQTSPCRIVVVSSLLHEKGVIDFDNLNGEKSLRSRNDRFNPGYCNSKLANMYFTKELATRTKGMDIEVCALCPGFTYTGLFRYTKHQFKWYQWILFAPIAFFFMRTASQGAQTVLHCATVDKVEPGGFYRNCVPYVSKKTFDPAVASKLWDASVKLVKLEPNEETWKT